MILYFFIYSTWSSRNGLYIEDLYVRSQHRRQGIGRALMSEAARVAVHAGCHYVEWMVLDSNSDAIKFYDSIGAVALSECSVMRVAGEGLELLSNVRTEG
jgi:ribosomal protein S18 acetylase RimI-like enzyme